ncbi:sugar phosphate isomerase/epimerase family protein [Fontivita pretiosa]|uniref:sugar phosphate isomerase/epimerase family protein n=1 Tax=Fontivita pretiosa TaxID=2989684 RepID=UPI003D178E78
MELQQREVSRRQVLASAIGLAAGLSPAMQWLMAQEPATAPLAADAPATAPAPRANKRFKVAGDDLFLNNRRQNIQAFTIAKKAGLDGVSVDMGSMKRLPDGSREFTNKLRDPAVRQQFLEASRATGVEIASLAFFAMYAWVFPDLPKPVEMAEEWVDTLVKMNVKVGMMPLMAKDGTLAEPEHAGVWKRTVEIFRKVAPQAEKAGVILGVESNLDGDGYRRFLDDVGSPNVQAYYNPGRALEFKYDAYKDIRDLGKDRICALHLEQGSVPPETFERRLGDGLIDFRKLREALLEIGWGGWMSIARSRLKGTTSAETNMLANAKFVHEIFPE